MDLTKELELIEKSGFTFEYKMAAGIATSSLRYLKDLAVRLNLPMEQLKVEHIISDMVSQDEKLHEYREWFSDIQKNAP